MPYFSKVKLFKMTSEGYHAYIKFPKQQVTLKYVLQSGMILQYIDTFHIIVLLKITSPLLRLIIKDTLQRDLKSG